MAVKEKFPPWFHRIRLALEEGWQHHGICEHISLTSTFHDDPSAPVFQEIFGGAEDGKKVWTPFVFDATDLVVPGLFTVPGLKIEKMAVLTSCPECQHGPKLVRFCHWQQSHCRRFTGRLGYHPHQRRRVQPAPARF